MSSTHVDPLPRTRVEYGWSRTLSVTSAVLPIARVRTRWQWGLAGTFLAIYVAVGVWLIRVQGYTINDANARTVSAEIMVLSRDPHLGAMGFYWPPLPMLIRIPLVLVLHPFGQVILAGPISTALCAAAVIPVLARIGREVGISTRVSAVLVGVYASNPVTVFSAANGMSEALFALAIACTMLGLIRFTNDRSVRSLGMTGLALGVGMATRIEFVPLTLAVATVCVAIAAPELRRRTFVIVVVPPAFVFAIWTWASSLIAGDALLWYHAGRESAAAVGDRPWLPERLTTLSILGYVGAMVVLLAPSLVAAIAVGVTRRRHLLATLGLTLVAATLPAFVAFQLLLDASTGEPRYFATMPLLECVLAMWVVGRTEIRRDALRRALPVVLAIGCAVGAVVATIAYADPVRTQVTKDGAFFAAVAGRPLPAHPDQERMLEPIMRVLEPQLAAGRLVAMDSRGGNAIMFSAHPNRFLVPEDRDFEQIMSDPTGRFQYALIGSTFTSTATDTIRAAMGKAEGGHFDLVVTSGTYELYAFTAG